MILKSKNIFLKFSSNQQDFTIKLQSDDDITDNSNPTYYTFPKIYLLKKYQAWSNAWNNYIKNKRLSSRKLGGNKKRNEEDNYSISELHDKCSLAYQELISSLNKTLNNNDFKQSLELQLNGQETSARIICQFEQKESDIASIPWDHWDGLDDLYNQKELIVSISTPSDSTTYKSQSSPASILDSIEILMILGEYEEDQDNIDLNTDREAFESLKEDLEKRANIILTIIKSNSLENLKKVLLEKRISIIYYGGHSRAIDNDVELDFGKDEFGKEIIVRLSELSDIFQEIIGKGYLKIAIFNSCKSIGTAFKLLPFGLPYVIAMRESIADFHAHYYIRYLLESFVIGLPLNYAVAHCQPILRNAYNKLIDIPGASIIPALCLTPEAMNKLETPIIALPKLDQISYDMLALSNLAKARLAVAGYSEHSDLKIQEHYANQLHRKNIISTKELIEPIYISLDILSCSKPRMSGQCIWEITFLANFQDIKPIIWGKGYVNVKNGNSELLLDHRPANWYGETVYDKNGNPITALKLNKNETSLEISGKLSLTKYALHKIEQEYQKYAIENNFKNKSNVSNVSNFCGWLKDVNKQVYIIKYSILAMEKIKMLGSEWITNIEALSDEESIDVVEISNEAYNCTPFGIARNDLGITEFQIIRKGFISLAEFINRYQWTDNETNKLKKGGCDESWWDKLKVPDVIIVSEAKKPEPSFTY